MSVIFLLLSKILQSEICVLSGTLKYFYFLHCRSIVVDTHRFRFYFIPSTFIEVSSLLGLMTEYIFYCKRAILFLSSSKILTPRRVCPPPATKAGVHTRRAEREMGGSIFWKTREIGLPSPLTVKYVGLMIRTCKL
jgi:hypothetical protein